MDGWLIFAPQNGGVGVCFHYCEKLYGPLSSLVRRLLPLSNDNQSQVNELYMMPLEDSRMTFSDLRGPRGGSKNDARLNGIYRAYGLCGNVVVLQDQLPRGFACVDTKAILDMNPRDRTNSRWKF